MNQTLTIPEEKTITTRNPLILRFEAIDVKWIDVEGFTGISRVEIVVDVNNLPDNIPLETNVRSQKIAGRVRLAIIETLKADPLFAHSNHGIFLSASDCTYDTTTRQCSLIFTNPLLHGDMDGGHLYVIIQKFRHLATGPRQVMLHVYLGIKDKETLVTLVQRLNSSVQVTEQSISNSLGRYDGVKAALSGQPYFQNIGWEENDPAPIKLKDIIEPMMQFNSKLFPESESRHPHNVYRKPNLARKNFETNEEDCQYLYDFLPEVLLFRDYIEKRFPEIYNNKSGRKLGHRVGVKSKTITLPFSNYKTDLEVSNGYIAPIFSAFRQLLVQAKNGKWHWIAKPEEVFDQLGLELLGIIFPDVLKKKRGQGRPEKIVSKPPEDVGNDLSIYQTIYMKVQMHLIRTGLAHNR